MIARLTALYLVLFIAVLASLNVVAYVFVGQIYAGELQPALGTPEYAAAYAGAMRHVAQNLIVFDLPLLVLVGAISYVLARTSIRPLVLARERERILAADAAHELRSPLATIATVAQAARLQPPSEKDEALRTIASTALDASDLIGHLLTLAREPDAHALACEPVDLSVLVRQCVSEFTERAAAAGITIDVVAAPVLVNGDARRLKELVRNLLDNALRHARARVTVRSREDGRCACVDVSDDGPGVPDAEREKIFERFYRVEPGAEGSGLGLAITRWVARAHGGDVTLGGAPGSGACFITTLPRLSVQNRDSREDR
ncbi:MAG: HAMP domain-containing histidine kinase [Candidatus Eremiobacteraeota bacterium]|nr:HAMP domain-containing histidine kinase [Candidatus Eremiobacteraeota bacterium]